MIGTSDIEFEANQKPIAQTARASSENPPFLGKGRGRGNLSRPSSVESLFKMRLEMKLQISESHKSALSNSSSGSSDDAKMCYFSKNDKNNCVFLYKGKNDKSSSSSDWKLNL